MNRKAGDWDCKSCQHLNFSRRDSCQRCGDQRMGGAEHGVNIFGGVRPAGVMEVKPGDWYCACGVHNFASRSNCFKCGGFKDGGLSIGPGTQTFSYCGVLPGWKSGDWICFRSGCNEHNFASRMECHRCNAPRQCNGV
ncbi:hypothetical protein KSP39_PZI019059 [Platanthera zijinensis]|uniref:RanBP2-type domain-containing protein n=1 Tax=Platanthera zijinensis TaxID=2320716 RepID=A0AAP0FXM1_9ASPA